jgi:hypothetical protein
MMGIALDVTMNLKGRMADGGRRDATFEHR